jgi:predicted nucleic acid-binding protein
VTAYLDSGVLIAYLYEEVDHRAKAEQAKRLFDAIVARRFQGIVSFYVLPELYGYVTRNYLAEKADETFRNSLVELFRAPLIVKPYVDRTDAERLRRRFTISDSADIPHVVAALFYGCSELITFDHHFNQVAHLMPIFTPDEFLTTLTHNSNAK